MLPGRFAARFAAPVRALTLSLALTGLAVTTNAQNEKKEPVPQPRTSMEKVAVPIDKVIIDDGDTAVIQWAKDDAEIIRILGIDTPEIQHIEHNIPYDQSFGREASGFAKGAFGMADEVHLLRSATLDPYGRTLGYLYINGKNYSAMIVKARLAAESVSFYGDNGLPEPAQEVLAAAESAGPVPFEPPYQFRRRMREVVEHEKKSQAKTEPSSETKSEAMSGSK